MMRRVRAGVALAIAALVAGCVFATPSRAQGAPTGFPHERHATVFPLCVTCHAGVVTPGAPMWPDAARCASCHDGTVQRRVAWTPRAGPRAGNRRFTHEAHSLAAAAKNPGDSALIRNCAGCHNAAGAPRMTVRNAVIGQCLTCHGLTAPHLDVPSEACATCHVRLTDAPTLTRDAIARFPKPASHRAPDFLAGGHGKAARVPGSAPNAVVIAASCSTCHSRNLCITCHVNAPEMPVIRALALDGRPPVYAGGSPSPPPSHAAADFLHAHSRDAQRATATCATCHARESCTTCHVAPLPRAVAALPSSGPGRAAGVQLARSAPSTHTRQFKEGHGPMANARAATCEGCHVRSTCLECHRPGGARESAYHPAGFLTRHPNSAYAREANCSDCHNPAQFCQSCHQRAGLVATSRLGRAGYHDAFRGFSLGHGQAARQSLESCASCHAERDCTACHSSVGGGFRFSPHGPGFKPERERSKNPSVCVACHGRAIPKGG